MVARGSFGLMLLQGNLQKRSCRQRPRWTKRRSTLSRKRSSSKRMIRLRLAVPTNVIETAGEGIEGRVEGRNVVLGGVRFVTSKLLRAEGRSIRRPTQSGAAIVAVAIDGKLAAHLVLADELRPGVIDILRSLRRLRVERTVLATSAPIWAWSPGGQSGEVDYVGSIKNLGVSTDCRGWRTIKSPFLRQHIRERPRAGRAMRVLRG